MKKIVILVICLLFLCSCNGSSMKTSGKINCNDIDTILKYENNPKLIDVRESDEYSEKHLDNAINISYTNIVIDIKSLNDISLDTPIIVYCKSGVRSAKAYEALKNAGYKHVYDLGSINNCSK